MIKANSFQNLHITNSSEYYIFIFTLVKQYDFLTYISLFALVTKMDKIIFYFQL